MACADTHTAETPFPARAGMNRITSAINRPLGPVPRTRGDEPVACADTHTAETPFPARAGMNRERTP